MPIYEYRCQDCGKIATVIVLSFRTPLEPKCPKCQSARMTKLISRVARVRSEERRLESLADPSKLGGLDENDPASMARWMKRMGKELGEDAGEDFEGMIDQAMEDESSGGQGSEAEGQDFKV